MRVHADVDPNAPAYVKPSPSVSGDDAGLSPQALTCLTCPHTYVQQFSLEETAAPERRPWIAARVSSRAGERCPAACSHALTADACRQ